MCEPVSIGLAVTSAGMKYAGERQAAKAEEEYTNDLNEATLKQNQAEMGNINLRMVEGEDIASRKDEAIATEAMKNESTANVTRGESGASGQSMDLFMDDFRAHSAKMRFAISRDQKSDSFKFQRSMAQQRVSTLGQLKSQSRPIAQANGAAAALDAAGSVMAIKSSYDRTEAIKAGAKTVG